MPSSTCEATTNYDSKPSTKPKEKARMNKLKTTTFEKLRLKYNCDYTSPTPSQQGSINHFFNTAKVTWEWSASKFLDIPGEKLSLDLEAKTIAMNAKVEEDRRFSSSVSIGLPNTSTDHISQPTSINNRKFPGKTNGIPFELINGLPEVAFLGRCNAGKSTLLNNLTTQFSQIKLNDYAKASRKAGFTKTINCYNVGRRFRIIDTPGYGIKSTQEQGKVTMQYLRDRKELRRSFLLISAEQGFSRFDSQIIDFLTTFGIPFEIVFTKLDKVRDTSMIERIIDESRVLELPTQPQMIFLNSVTNKQFKRRYGIGQLRWAILQSCGLAYDIKPSRTK